MRDLPHTHSCFVCGDSNASGLKLHFESDGKTVHTRFLPGPEHVGFQQIVHGGLIATVLDEIMVWACAVVTRRFAVCAELNVRFINPLRPGEETLARGELANNRRDKIYEARAELRNATGTVFATATGKYLPVKESDMKAMLTDFAGDTSGLFQSQP